METRSDREAGRESIDEKDTEARAKLESLLFGEKGPLPIDSDPEPQLATSMATNPEEFVRRRQQTLPRLKKSFPDLSDEELKEFGA